MKLSLTPLFLLFVAYNVQAQITITSQDLPEANNVYPVMNAIDGDNNDPEATGTNYTWDYSNLQDIATVEESYVTVSSAPLLYQFLFNSPFNTDYQADMAIKRLDQEINVGITLEDYYEFYRVDNTVYARVGVGATVNGFAIPAITDPIDTLFALPLNFDYQDTSYSELLFEIPTFATYLNQQTRRIHADGWGTVITPYGSFQALRVRTEIDARDSISIPEFFIEQAFDRPMSIEYAWYANGEGVPVLKIVSTAGIQTLVQYKTEEIIENISENSEINFSIFPVPASNQLNLKMSRSTALSFWSISDASGRSVLHGNSSGLFDSIDISNLNSGIYQFVLSQDGINKTQNFIVQKK